MNLQFTIYITDGCTGFSTFTNNVSQSTNTSLHWIYNNRQASNGFGKLKLFITINHNMILNINHFLTLYLLL